MSPETVSVQRYTYSTVDRAFHCTAQVVDELVVKEYTLNGALIGRVWIKLVQFQVQSHVEEVRDVQVNVAILMLLHGVFAAIAVDLKLNLGHADRLDSCGHVRLVQYQFTSTRAVNTQIFRQGLAQRTDGSSGVKALVVVLQNIHAFDDLLQ